MTATQKPVVLVTGFPRAELAARLARQLLETQSEHDVVCVVSEIARPQAETWWEALSPQAQARVRFLEGADDAMDLGLSGRELKELAARVRVIHHCAGHSYAGGEKSQIDRACVTATSEALEVAELATDLERFVHWSSTSAVGDDHGAVVEDRLLEPESDTLARARFRAERMVRDAAEQVPITVLRPSMIVGDSHTGETERFDGPYLLIRALLNSPDDLRLPVPGSGDALLNCVPIDYAVAAGLAITSSSASLGRAFHIIDPQPPTVREAFELFAALTGRPKPERSLPGPLAKALLRAPGILGVGQAPRGLIDDLGRAVRYDDRNARPLLDMAGLRCPSLRSYAETLIEFVQNNPRSRVPSRPPAPQPNPG